MFLRIQTLIYSMKSIFAISGSPNSGSSNTEFLIKLKELFSEQYEIDVYSDLFTLPLFSPQSLQATIPDNVIRLKEKVASSDAVIISTPEYLHNIPAVLKNALEWMTASGELYEKPTLPITLTPAPPRGKYAMMSLIQSLKAANAKVVGELSLYKSTWTQLDKSLKMTEEDLKLIRASLEFL